MHAPDFTGMYEGQEQLKGHVQTSGSKDDQCHIQSSMLPVFAQMQSTSLNSLSIQMHVRRKTGAWRGHVLLINCFLVPLSVFPPFTRYMVHICGSMGH